MKRAGLVLLIAIVSPAGLFAGALSEDAPKAANPILAGYAVVTPIFGDASDLQVFQTFAFAQGVASSQSGSTAPQLTTHALLFVNISERLGRDLGLAIANPGGTEAQVTLALRRDDGILVGTETLFIPPRWQTSQFVTQFFAGQLTLPHELTGTMSITSNTPVAIVGVRFRGSAFSVQVPTQLSSPSSVPQILPGVGGSGSFLLPNFIQGGGWATEIVLSNTGTSDLTVRLDLFNGHGDPLAVPLNGPSRSTFFNLRVRAGGVLVVAPLDSNGNNQF